MKKNIFLSAIVATAITLTGCSSSSDSGASSSEQSKDKKVFVNNNANGMSIEMVLYYDGDKVTKQESKTTIPYEKVNMNKEQLKVVLEPLAEKVKGLKGVTRNLEFGDKEAVESMMIDYKVADINKVNEALGKPTGGDIEFVSLKKTMDDLKAAGFTEK